MAADGSDSASFTVRLVNQVMAPARQIKAAMGDVEKAIKQTQKAMSAPAPRRGALSDWDKMMSGSKRSQASDFARHQSAVAKATASAEIAKATAMNKAAKAATVAQAKQVKSAETAAKKQLAIKQGLDQMHADHGLGAMLVEGGSDAAIGATLAIAAAAAAAAAAVVYLGVKFGEAAIEGAMFAQKSQMAIGFLTDSAGQGSTEFENVRSMAQTLGLQVDQTVHSFQRLLASQFEVGQSKSLIKMAADMQAIGASGEEVQRILYALDEVKSIGTLQKRQERMLMMAGISGQLIDQALQKRMGLSSIEKVHAARKGNKIDADTAIEAIKDAVMHKVHEGKLGEAGAAFASTTLTGMQNQAHAAIENFFITVGELILPGLTKIAAHIRDGVGAVMDDPTLAQLGTFLLSEFDIFVLWVDANWPELQATFVTGAEAMAASIRFVIECLDDATVKGKVVEGVLIALAVALALLGFAGLMVSAPIWVLIGLIGALVYAIVVAVDWIAGKIKALGEFLGLAGGAAGSAVDPGVKGWGGVPMVDDFGNVLPSVTAGAANDNGIQGVNASGGTQALQNMQGTTEGGQASGGSPVQIDSLAVHVQSPEDTDPDHFGQKVGQAVHTELAKLMRQAS